MKLTPAERTVLHNLFEVLKTARPSDGRYYERLQEIVRYGFEGEYHNLAPIDLTASVDPESCSFVMTVVDMYWILQMHARQAEYTDRRLAFPGFDGNRESKFWAYAGWVVDDPHAFEGFEAWMDNLNSHLPMSDRYRAMLPVYQEELRACGGEPLAVEAIRRVLDAGSPE